MEAVPPHMLRPGAHARLRVLRLLEEQARESIEELLQEQDQALNELRKQLEALDETMSNNKAAQ